MVVVPGGGVGENPIPKAREFPPQWPGASPLQASLTLSQKALRLPIITLKAGNSRKVVTIAGNNLSRVFSLASDAL